jgi:hydroxymethylglutaryl-CoA reductase (NADPH)
MNLRDYKTVTERREAVENELAVSLPHIGQFSLDEQQASTKNCENMIGAVQVPVGIAGPIKIQSSSSSVQSYYVPLATTEGALVASVSRGCKAITESGGAIVLTKKIGITRAPVFVVQNILEGEKLITWVEENFEQLKEITQSTSSHLTLLDIKPFAAGRNVFLRFRFDTQEAMGMNMATIACSHAVQVIERETGVACLAISGNMCVDKKSNFLNFIEGRGIQVKADVTLSKDIVSSVLKTTPQKLAETAKRKLVYGSILSGSIGANAHIANVIAAIFLATGQDIAHVGECSMGVTEIDEVDGDLYASILLPDLIIGTVGGGTQLATQKEALSILGKNTLQLAQVIGGAVLAGEISLLASLTEGSLATSHEKLGRGKKT